MSNSYLHSMDVQGTEADVSSFVAALQSDAWPLRDLVEKAPTIEAFVPAVAGAHGMQVNFSIPGRHMLGGALVEQTRRMSDAHPGLVMRLAVVELGNGVAEARVFRAAAEAARYTMPNDEIDDLAGDEMDEGAVISALVTTLNGVVEVVVEHMMGTEQLVAIPSFPTR